MNPAFPINARSEQVEVRPISAAGTGSVAVLLRAEALVELALVVSAYRYLGGAWLMFATLFLVPDLSMVGYLINPRVGARLYNLAHTYIAPALLALVGFVLATSLVYSLALIWAAHIGFDRFLGYGLKYPAAFGATHLGWKVARGSAYGCEP
jgi:hypothetical protein